MQRSILFASPFCAFAFACGGLSFAETIPFADDGTLKMLYDNRMYPQAVEHEGSVFVVWRGEKGLPFINSYDLESREFAAPYMLLTGREDGIDFPRYVRDHHFAPIVWVDSKGHLHTLFGCHSGRAGIHLISENPGDMRSWLEQPRVSSDMSYPKSHRIYDDKTLLYFRNGGHLSSWMYRITSDGGKTWESTENSLVDLNAEPQDGILADHAGSYHTTQVSEDGTTLHVAFIWKVEDPVHNSRYNKTLGDHTQRYNLYYLKVDLPTGKAFSHEGKEIEIPVRKSIADRDCLVWDTDERVAAVGPSIWLDEGDEPFLLLPVSGETPHRCQFYFVRYKGGEWSKTAITGTPHPFNACHLERSDDGALKAYLVAGDGEIASDADVGMDGYGWGDRIEEWISNDDGETWRKGRDLAPATGQRYQNIKFVSRGMQGLARDMFLFYAWPDPTSPGTAYLWDNRE